MPSTPILHASDCVASLSPDARMMMAAAAGQESTLRRLLDSGHCDPRATNRDGRTALMMAAVAGSAECVAALLPISPVDAADDEGETALFFACKAADSDSVKLLLDAGRADPNKANRRGESPLIAASSNSAAAIVQLLLDAGANPNQADDRGVTPLIKVSMKEGIAELRMLLAAGANPKQANLHGETPLSYLAVILSLEGLRLLAPLSDLGAVDNNGQTALMLACSSRSSRDARACVEFLAPRSNVLLANNGRWTAFDLAILVGRHNCVDFLAPFMPRATAERAFLTLGARGPELMPEWAARVEAEALMAAADLSSSHDANGAVSGRAPARL